MAGEEQRRQVACKVRVSCLVNGKYVKEEGWTPNYVLTEQGIKVSRVNIMGAAVDTAANEGESFKSIVLDDGTARISVRDFEKSDILDKVNVGEIILVIGKPREYGGEKYIIPEVIRKVENKKWIEVRKLELNLGGAEVSQAEPEIREHEQEKNIEVEDVGADEAPRPENESMGVFEKIIEYVSKNDSGEGVDVSEVIKGVEGASEKNINKLLLEGEIFEIRAGKIKVL